MRPSSAKCPYCKVKSDCSHLLLEVDRTYLEATAGTLLGAFQERWDAAYQPDEPGFDEILSLQTLLDLVDKISDKSRHYDLGPPGSSSAYTAYFCSSEHRVSEARENFVAFKARTAASG